MATLEVSRLLLHLRGGKCGANSCFSVLGRHWLPSAERGAAVPESGGEHTARGLPGIRPQRGGAVGGRDQAGCGGT
jgi:hypothetical protein